MQCWSYNVYGLFKHFGCDEKVELLCKLAMPRLSSLVFERKGFGREMVSNCNVGATTYTVCWVGTDQGVVGTDQGAARLTIERSFPRSP